MKNEVYENWQAPDDFSVVDFISEGKKNIAKRIVFTSTELANVYNLAFGDINEDGEIDDYSISNNGDRDKLLATIADVVKKFTDKHPERLILFKGSTIERNRLYRMAIGSDLEELSLLFDIYVYNNEEIMPFARNIEVTAFLIKRKIL